MNDPDELIPLFERGHWLIKRQTDGLTHDESMLRLPFYDNCLNWIVGHIVYYRDRILELIGESVLMGEEEAVHYQRESKPLTAAEEAVPLDRLLELLEVGQSRLAAALANVPADVWSAMYNEERGQTTADRIAFLQWHETYHVGQLEIFRQLAGKADSII